METTTEAQRTNEILRQEIKKREHIEEVLRNIALGVSSKTGEAFFQSLVEYLAKAEGVAHASIGEFATPKQEGIKVIAGYANGRKMNGLIYLLAGTPCEEAIRQGIRIYPTNVQQYFPQDDLLRVMEIEAYLGIALVNSAGKTLGIINVMNHQPFKNIQLMEEILKIFAVRAGLELERRQAEKALRESEEHYRTILEKRDRYLSALVEVQQRLLKTEVTDNIYSNILEPLGQASETSRVLIFENHRDEQEHLLANLRAEWCADGFASIIADRGLQHLLLDTQFSCLADTLARGGTFLGIASELPQLQGQFLTARGIKSFLAFPLIVKDRLFGFISFSDCKIERRWETLEIEVLRSGATAIALAIERQQIEEELEYRVAERTLALQQTNMQLIQEILEREEIEIALRETSEQLQDLFDNANDLIHSVSLENGRFIYVNRAWQKTLGYTQEESIHLSVWDTLLPEYRESCQTTLKQFQRGELQQLNRIELTLLTKEGNTVVVEGSINCRFVKGKPVAMRAILRDVTEQKRIGAAIQESEAKYRALMNDASDAIAILDVSGNILEVNRKARESIGYSLEEIVHMNRTHFVSKSLLQQAQHLWEKLLKTGSFIWTDGQIVSKDGRLIPVDVTASVIFYADKRVIQIIIRDITERKLAEQEMHKALAQEKELNDLKTRFVNIASHEFRTPLTTILGAADLLENYGHKLSDEKKQEHLHQICDASNRMKEMIEDILHISRATSGQLQLNLTPIDLDEFCRNLVKELKFSLGQHHQIDFTTQASCARFKSHLLYLDERILYPILSNLLSNAIKYSDRGSTIHFCLEYKEGMVIFHIQDRGIGIPREDQAHLFESFYRAKNVGNIAGTGLGLNIVKQYVEILGGNLKFTSEVGLGSIFSVTLPISQAVETKINFL